MPLMVTLALGCGGEPSSSSGPTPEPEPAPLTRAQLVVDADRRVASEAMLAGVHDPDPGLRRAAVLALGRLHQGAQIERLLLALRDTDPRVRAAASLGLGALEQDATEPVVRALVGAIAAEPDPAIRAHMIRDLGRLRRDAGLAVVAAALRAEEAVERAAGCAAAAEWGLAGEDVPGPLRARLAALLGAEEPVEVRLACAYALARLPAGEHPGEAVALTLAAADPEPEVRALAYRALARQPVALDALLPGARDADWRVQVQAYRALAARAANVEGGAAAYARALEEAHARAITSGDVAPGPTLHVLLAALDAAAPMARSTPVHDLAERLLESLGEPPPDQPATRARGLAHCAAAELTDRGRGWPSRVEECGLEQVLPRERRVLTATILGDLDGAEAQRVARLARLARDRRPVVQEAALGAAAKIWSPEATELVLEALESTEDPGVLAAGLEALARLALRAPTEARVPPPLPADRALEALRAAGAALDDGALEGQLRWLDAVDAVSARALLEPVRALAAHPNHAVRSRARALLASWSAPLPEGAPPSPNPIDPEALAPPEARPRVRLETDRGVLVIELRPDQAPVTVARFLALVRGGFYDGLTFHRVVPGFVVQGGDPRGDGYGGPGFWQRCEDNRLPYVRGTVGMALAGRDTGGSQFFITHAAQPHLEGRYTAFGRVVDGLEHLDQLHPGDSIRRATILGE